MGTIFMFSPTTTSASFVLRKHYFSLLYHYEQVYFFNIQGPLCSPTGTYFIVLFYTFFDIKYLYFLIKKRATLSNNIYLLNSVSFHGKFPFSPSAVTFPVCSRSCKPELALVQYSPKTINDPPLNHHIEGKKY